MKKVIFILAIFIILFTCSCKKNNAKVQQSNNENIKILNCKGMNKGNNMNVYSNIVYKFKNDKLYKTNLEATFKDIEIDNLPSEWESIKEQFTEQNEPVEEVGYKRSVKSDDKNYAFTVILDIDFETITEETSKKYEISYNSDITYDEVLENTTKDGTITCE